MATRKRKAAETHNKKLKLQEEEKNKVREEEEEEDEEEDGWVVLHQGSGSDSELSSAESREHKKPRANSKKNMKKAVATAAAGGGGITGKLDRLARVQVTSRAGMRRWLETHHRSSPGIWLVRYNKNAGDALHVSYADAVEELLCFGWIDSRAGKYDEQRSMVVCTPRRPNSVWSALNKRRVAQLEAAGLMAERGAEVVREAKESGQWDSLNDVEALVVPQDLSDALEARPGARANWDGFPPSTRRNILLWITQAKRAETRSKRVQETASKAELNQRAK